MDSYSCWRARPNIAARRESPAVHGGLRVKNLLLAFVALTGYATMLASCSNAGAKRSGSGGAMSGIGGARTGGDGGTAGSFLDGGGSGGGTAGATGSATFGTGGAVVLVVEEAALARRRGVRIYAELAGSERPRLVGYAPMATQQRPYARQ